jgi:uncharacterized ubiquitin-like protein YukD
MVVIKRLIMKILNDAEVDMEDVDEARYKVVERAQSLTSASPI